MNLQLCCVDNDEPTILLKTKGFDMERNNTKSLTAQKKKRSKRRRSKKNKPTISMKKLKSDFIVETVETVETESTENSEMFSVPQEEELISNDALFLLHEFEDFYLCNLQSPTFTNKKRITDFEYLKTELLLSGYFRNVETSLGYLMSKKIVEKIKNNCEKSCLNITDLCTDNHDLFLTDSKQLDEELGIGLSLNLTNLDNTVGEEYCINSHDDNFKISYDYSLTASPTSSSVSTFIHYSPQQQQPMYTDAYSQMYFSNTFQYQIGNTNTNTNTNQSSFNKCSYNYNNRFNGYSNMKIEKIVKLKLSLQELAE
eukprot:287307_1